MPLGSEGSCQPLAVACLWALHSHELQPSCVLGPKQVTYRVEEQQMQPAAQSALNATME